MPLSASAADPREPGGRSGRRVRLLLGLLLVGAFAVRIWFASGGLDYRRFFDERYTLDNVARILDGRLEPAWGWYPSLSYLPQAALLGAAEAVHRWTGDDLFKMRTGERFTPGAILICRTLGSLYGVLGIWLLFLVGRRLFDPPTGLLAAFLLSVVPEHLRLSAYIKPDSLLVVTVLVAFWLTLDLLERPARRTYLLAGAGVGLIAATKPYGVLAALPLGMVTALQARERPRRLLWLAAAGGVAAAVFVALNPHLGILMEGARSNLEIYGGRGEGRLSVLVHSATAPFSPTFHGPLIGAAAAAGLLLLCRGVADRSRTGTERRARGMVVVAVAGYALSSSALFTWAKGNLLLPAIPFTSLAAAYALTFAGRRLGRLRPAAAGAAAALVLWLQAALVAWAYPLRVPTTYAVASEYLAARLPRPLGGRLIWVEREGDHYLPPVRAWGHGQAAAEHTGDLAQAGRRRLDLADVEIFPLARLDEPGADFHARRLARFPESEDQVVRPGVLSRRGPALQMLIHPWNRRAQVRLPLEAAAQAGLLAGRVPALPQRRRNVYGSLEVLLGAPTAAGATLEVGGRRLPLYWARAEEGGHRFVSERFPLRPAPQPVRLRRRGRLDPDAILVSWSYEVPGRRRP